MKYFSHKPIIYIYYSIIIIFFSTQTATLFSQSRTWSLPPNYIKFNPFTVLPLPTQPKALNTVPNYEGQFSEYMHNAIEDSNGNLLFFIVDGIIYDKNGFGIDQINTDIYKGHSETIISPVPGNIDKYYIIITGVSGLGHLHANVRYVLLDLSITNIFTNRQGALVSPGQGLPPGNQAIFDAPNTFPISDLAPGFSTQVGSEIKTSMAITKLRADNRRLLLVMGEFDLFRFSVTSSGIFFEQHLLTLNYPNIFPALEVNFRAEMEIIEYLSGYKLAFAYPSIGGAVLHYSELDNFGNIVNSHNFKIPRSNFMTSPKIRGIEFSPNNRYLYVSHDSSFPNSTPFSVFDTTLNTTVPIMNNSLLNDINNFKNSQIELGIDNNLYLVNQTDMAVIGNSNDPSNLTWNNSKAGIQYHLSKLSFPITNLQVYPLPAQIDGENYLNSFLGFDVDSIKGNEEHYGTQTWSPGAKNPFGSINGTVTIKEKLIIKTGAKIYANNMRFEFSNNGILIIENGAYFSANNTTFTINDSCCENKMWKGIEVWGAPGFQPLVSGKFSTMGNSIIEHAIEAVSNSRHEMDINGNIIFSSFEKAFNGGIIEAKDTIFRNNFKSVIFEPYYSYLPSGNIITDRSRFINCDFLTDAPLNDPVFNTQISYVIMKEVNGVSFFGCDFNNKTTINSPFAYEKRPLGIQSIGSGFTITSRCTQGISPCPKNLQDPCRFINLHQGIFAEGKTGSYAKIFKSEFLNNWSSINLISMDFSEILGNRFDVGKNRGSGTQINLNSKGLHLNACNTFFVENNYFDTKYQGYLGILIENSGSNNNQIYKNTIKNFTIGSMTRFSNGNHSSNINNSGLEFKCNEYYDIKDFDILISNGTIKPFHGNCKDLSGPSNNKFSYTAQHGDIWLDSNVPINISYQYSPGGQNLAPRVGYFNSSVPSINPTLCTNLDIFNVLNSCPDRRIRTIRSKPPIERKSIDKNGK